MNIASSGYFNHLRSSIIDIPALNDCPSFKTKDFVLLKLVINNLREKIYNGLRKILNWPPAENDYSFVEFNKIR